MSIIVRCAACGTQNRVKEENVDSPLCGKCRTPLILQQNAAPMILTDLTFDNFIRNSHKPVLVDFWANWCGPCRMYIPILEAFAKSQRSIILAKVDTERNSLTTSKFQIFSIPTLILFVDGKEAKRLVGLMPLPDLERELSPWITVN